VTITVTETSHGLASYLERIAGAWPRRQQPAYGGEFHDLGKKWVAPAGPAAAGRPQGLLGHLLGHRPGLLRTRPRLKGLERRTVVLVVNEDAKFERSRERLYVGLSRARDQLVVCGDPDFIREVGGQDLARRLNIV
jgi:hypothetical protein